MMMTNDYGNVLEVVEDDFVLVFVKTVRMDLRAVSAVCYWVTIWPQFPKMTKIMVY